MKRFLVPAVVGFSMSFANGCSAEQDFDTSVTVRDEGGPVSNLVSGERVEQSTIENILATKDGYQLTGEDLGKANAIEAVLEGQKYTPEALIAEFEKDPAGTLSSINEIYTEVVASDGIQTTPSSIASRSQTQPELSVATVSQQGSDEALAGGHRQLRQHFFAILQRSGSGQRISEGAFNTPSVNRLRAYLKNSQIVSSGASEYASSAHTYVFCADGTFMYSYGGSMFLSSNVPGEWDAGGTLTDSARGYWDVYTENGNDAALLYSTDPGFLDQSMANTGLLPMPIAAYQADVVQLGARGMPATPDMLLRRTTIAGC